MELISLKHFLLFFIQFFFLKRGFKNMGVTLWGDIWKKGGILFLVILILKYKFLLRFLKLLLICNYNVIKIIILLIKENM